VKKIISVLAVLAIIGVAAVGAVFMSYNSDVKGGKGSSEEITVELEKGMGAYSVASVLAENGIVIISGVIDFRATEVEELISNDFEIIEQTKTDNWCCYVLKIK
jgi:cell division protein YceG involved in septum cleavage